MRFETAWRRQGCVVIAGVDESLPSASHVNPSSLGGPMKPRSADAATTGDAVADYVFANQLQRVPVPSTLALLVIGLATSAISLCGRRRRVSPSSSRRSSV